MQDYSFTGKNNPHLTTQNNYSEKYVAYIGRIHIVKIFEKKICKVTKTYDEKVIVMSILEHNVVRQRETESIFIIVSVSFIIYNLAISLSMCLS